MIKTDQRNSFAKVAKEYDVYAYLQQTIARELAMLFEDSKVESILDLGCGTGALWRALEQKPKLFVGVDISHEMLDEHPKDPAIRLVQYDFNDPSLYTSHYDIIVASSSLQWSKNLALSFDLIAKHGNMVAFAIFTSNSLREIHSHIGSKSPIPEASTIEELIKMHFDGELELKHYSLSFPSRIAMLSYLRGSGIAGNARLGYTESKRLTQDAPFEHLTFEVLFFIGKPKQGI
ncbi:MAG: methyltransferase domain-containing protein [Wolinella sp.]